MIGQARCLTWLRAKGQRRHAAEGAALFRPTELFKNGREVARQAGAMDAAGIVAQAHR